MKKFIVGSVLPLLVFGVFVSVEATTTASTTPNKNTLNEQALSCVKEAITAREDALLASKKTRFDLVLKNQEWRKGALLNAWSIPESKLRIAEVKKMWKISRAETLKYKKENMLRLKEIWNKYREEIKDCGTAAKEAKSLELQAADND